jgi:tetratricopeptide (TPR) repeat protein
MLRIAFIVFVFIISTHQLSAQEDAYTRAKSLLADGQAYACLNICDSVLLYQSMNNEFQLLKSEALIELNLLNQAIDLLTGIIYIQPRLAKAYALRGYSYVIKGSYKPARNDYLVAVQLDSTNALYYYNLANVEQLMEKWNDAVGNYTRAIFFDKSYVDAYKNRGYIHLNLFRYSLALRDFDSALKYRQNNTDIMLYRGMTLTSLKRYKEAMLMFDRCIRLKPQNGDAYFNKGLVYYQLKDYNRAISVLDSAITADEDLSIAYYHRALAKLELNKNNKIIACDDFRKAISKGNMEALYYIKKYCE